MQIAKGKNLSYVMNKDVTVLFKSLFSSFSFLSRSENREVQCGHSPLFSRAEMSVFVLVWRGGEGGEG